MSPLPKAHLSIRNALFMRPTPQHHLPLWSFALPPCWTILHVQLMEPLGFVLCQAPLSNREGGDRELGRYPSLLLLWGIRRASRRGWETRANWKTKISLQFCHFRTLCEFPTQPSYLPYSSSFRIPVSVCNVVKWGSPYRGWWLASRSGFVACGSIAYRPFRSNQDGTYPCWFCGDVVHQPNHDHRDVCGAFLHDRDQRRHDRGCNEEVVSNHHSFLWRSCFDRAALAWNVGAFRAIQNELGMERRTAFSSLTIW